MKLSRDFYTRDDVVKIAKELLGKTIWIEDTGIKISKNDITKNPRIGVDYVGKDALFPYRFTLLKP